MSQQQTVGNAQTDRARTINADASVTDAAQTMRDEDVSILAVIDDEGDLVGVITDRDVAILIVAEGADADSTSVRDAMSDQPVAVNEGDSLDQAFQRMLDENVHRAPVTASDGQVSGMLSQHDAAREGEGRSVGGSPGEGSAR
jgi:CBS domain-containing protein